jgi:lysophospholipase L1-like esterase
MGATVPPTRFENDKEYNFRKLSVNNEIIHFFKTEKIAYAKLYAHMGDPSFHGNLKPAFDAGDGLHFSVSGYKKMGEIIYEDGFRNLIQSLIECV